jgi:hypothetical protein
VFFLIDVVGDRRVARRLATMGANALNATPAFNQIVDVMLDIERDIWHDHPWTLADSTLARKERQHQSPYPLVNTSLLEHALTSDPVTAQARGVLIEVRPNELAFGIRGGNVPIFYGRILQKGRKRGRGRGGPMPPRKVIPRRLNSQQRDRVNRILIDHLVQTGPLGGRRG